MPPKETPINLNLETDLVPRPKREIEVLFDKVERRLEICTASMSRGLSATSEEYLSLRNEKANLCKLSAFLQFVLFGQVRPGYSLSDFRSCTIVTRHFGEDNWDLPRIFNSLKERHSNLQDKLQSDGVKNSEEFTELSRLLTCFKWYFDEYKDTDIGNYFAWSIFSKNLQNEFVAGKFKDEYNTPERIPLEARAGKVLTSLQEAQAISRIENNISFLKNRSIHRTGKLK